MTGVISRFSTLLTAVALLGTSAGCSASLPIIHTAPARQVGLAANFVALDDAGPAARLDRHVIVISIDGLRPDAISRFGAETIERLIEEGGYSLSAQTILPSITLPSHTSMLTGSQPDVHGITWNDNRVDREGRVAVPTIFGLARSRGLTTAAFASKGKFNHLFAPEDLDYFVVPTGNGSWSASHTADLVGEYLAAGNRPNLLFVHFREPDRYGHIFGWMGWIYGWAVREADKGLEEILEDADRTFGEDGYTVILTADHGGHGRTHGSDVASDRTIPWVAWGQGVVSGEISEPIKTTDTAATALWLLGVPPSTSVSGSPVVTAFDRTGLAPVNARLQVD